MRLSAPSLLVMIITETMQRVYKQIWKNLALHLNYAKSQSEMEKTGQPFVARRLALSLKFAQLTQIKKSSGSMSIANSSVFLTSFSTQLPTLLGSKEVLVLQQKLATRIVVAFGSHVSGGLIQLLKPAQWFKLQLISKREQRFEQQMTSSLKRHGVHFHQI